jgi:hypothetical protein
VVLERAFLGSLTALALALVLTGARTAVAGSIIIIPIPPLPGGHETDSRSVALVSARESVDDETRIQSLQRFGDPRLNDRGEVVVAAHLRASSNSSYLGNAVLIASETGLTVAARRGDGAPDGNGSLFTIDRDVRINDRGTVLLRSTLDNTAGGTADDKGLFVFRDGALQQVARSGNPVPGGPDAFDAFGRASLNDADQVGFIAGFRGDGVDPQHGDGVLRWDPDGATHFLAGESTLVTDPAGDLIPLGSKMGQQVWMGENGTVAVQYPGFIELDGSGASQASEFYWNQTEPAWDASGGLTYLASAGGPAPPIVNRTLIHDDGEVTRILAPGDAMPDGYHTVSSIGAPVVSPAGDVGFKARLARDGDPSVEAMFRWDGETLHQVVQEGQSVDFDGTRYTIAGVDDAAISPSGILAFTGDLSRYPTTERAILLADDDELVLLSKTATDDLYELEGGPDFGGNLSINERGQVAYWDGSDVIRLATPALRWKSGGSGSWEDDDAWTLGIRPEDVHPVAIGDHGESIVVRGPSVDTAVHSLEIGRNSTLELPSIELDVGSWLEVDFAGELKQAGGTVRSQSVDVVGYFDQRGAVHTDSYLISGHVTSSGATTVEKQTYNGGTLEIESGAHWTTRDFWQTDGTTVLDGRLSVATGLDLDGGTMGGDGVIDGSLDHSRGTLSPGNSIGDFEIEEDYWQQEDALVLIEIDLSSDEVLNDVLRIGGSAHLGGVIGIELVDGSPAEFGITADPETWQEIDVLVAAEILDEGLTITSLDLSGFYRFVEVEEGHALRLTLVPEPGSALLLALGLCAIGMTARGAQVIR